MKCDNLLLLFVRIPHRLVSQFFTALLLLLSVTPVWAASLQTQYNFDRSNPFSYWASNGAYKIHELGVVPSRDSSRGNAGKFDIQLIDASYLYLSIPARIPLGGSLKLSGDIRVEHALKASVALGGNIAISPIRHSGVYVMNALKKPSRWITQSADIGYASREKASKLVDKFFYGVNVDAVGVALDRIGLFIRGKPGGRIVFYVDKIFLQGEVPDQKRHTKQTEKAWAAAHERVRQTLTRLSGTITASEAPATKEALRTLRGIQSETNTILKNFDKHGFISPEVFDKLYLYAETVKHLGHPPGNDLTVYPWDPTSPILILPKSDHIPAKPGPKISIKACRGEYEPASFILRSSKMLPNLTITAHDLRTASGHVIPRSAIDKRLVKCWFQAGSGDLLNRRTKKLVPELLLKDNDLVRVDLEKRTNALRGLLNGKIQYFDITDPLSKVPPNTYISDANTLKPFDLPPDFNQQIWLTVKIPNDAESGDYRGKIDISSMGNPIARLSLHIKVLPFELPPPTLEYSIYYRGKLVPELKAGIGSEFKSESQYRLEMADLMAHGIDAPTLYQPFDRFLDRALRIRHEMGMANKNLYILDIQTKPPFNSHGLAKLETRLRRWQAVAKQMGYRRLYVYGIDEARDDLIAAQLPAWRIVNNNGGRVFVACPHHADTIAGERLDLAILNGPLDHGTAIRWARAGLKVFSYGNPQVGVENPAVYRTNYGFKLWAAGYSGAMNYAYQHAFGDIWNDFDHTKYRDHVFAYPLTTGLLGTIQFEGFREAVDDIRYLTALLKTKKQSQSKLHGKITMAIQDGLSPSMMRQSLIQQILEM